MSGELLTRYGSQFWHNQDQRISYKEKIPLLEDGLNPEKQHHLILVPGMQALIDQLVPLYRALRSQLSDDLDIVTVSNGRSWEPLDTLVRRVTKPIENKLKERGAQEITLFGHSHGGRIAAASVNQLAQSFPDTHFTLITGGTPIVLRPQHTWSYPFNMVLSRSFREWPDIVFPETDNVTIHAFYSPTDEVVTEFEATQGWDSQYLHKIEGFSHTDFLHPDRMIPYLLPIVPTSSPSDTQNA